MSAMLVDDPPQILFLQRAHNVRRLYWEGALARAQRAPSPFLLVNRSGLGGKESFNFQAAS